MDFDYNGILLGLTAAALLAWGQYMLALLNRPKMIAEAHKVEADAVGKLTDRMFDLLTLTNQQQIQINRMREDFDQSKRELQEDLRKRDAAIDTHRKEIVRLESELKQERKCREELSGDLARVISERDGSRRTIEELVNQVKELQERVKELTRERDALSRLIAALQTQKQDKSPEPEPVAEIKPTETVIKEEVDHGEG